MIPITLPRTVLIAVVLSAALFPLIGATFYIQLGAKIMIMAIFALSLDLLVGHTGLVSLGHAAYFGVAAYALALISPKYEAANLWLTLPAAIAVAALAALIIGFFVVRTAGVYFIMVTLAFAQMLYSVFHDTKLGGGSDGIYIYVRPELTIAGFKPLDLENPVQFYYFALILLVFVYAFLHRVLHAPFGRALAGIRLNEQRMRSIGFPVFAYKLGAFVLAGALAGLAGYLAACQFGFVNPDILAWQQSGVVLMMVILGGMGRLHGAVLGAFSYVLLQEIFSAPALLGAYAKHWQLAMGGLIVMIVLVFPHGIGGFLDIALRRISYRRLSRPRTERHMTSDEILKIRGLCKHFGGLAAVDNVSLQVRTGELHAVIGPNGAGKTTLVNLLSGDLPASSGSILFRERDITKALPERRSRLGIGRSYQKTNIFLGFTVLENCRLAAQSRAPRPLNWWRDASSYGDEMERARRALAAVELADRADEIALALSHGEQRQLELAICLATEPQLLLLDEPLAGMGAEESQKMVGLIGRLVDTHAILLVEHDMDAVFQLAGVLTVMVNGKVLATGAPAEIRANREVQNAYLGNSDKIS